MSEPEDRASSKKPGAMVWTGRVLSALVSLMLGFGGVMALTSGPEMAEGMAQFGLPASMIVPMGIIEIVCAVLFLVPQTCVLGAILITGYLGGAVCTHWRVEDPLALVPIVFGVVVWVAVCLREPRLWKFMPLKVG